jgi:hypothetical protein
MDFGTYRCANAPRSHLGCRTALADFQISMAGLGNSRTDLADGRIGLATLGNLQHRSIAICWLLMIVSC